MAEKGSETPLYKWRQLKDEVVVTIKPPVDGKNPVLPIGAKVLIHGLQKAPAFNWTPAEVVGPLQNERFRVRCAREDKKEINVRPRNLCIIPKRNDVEVEFLSRELRVHVAGKTVVEGKLKNLIITDESTWYMDTYGLPELLLAKQDHDWWAGVIEGDAEIEVDILEGEKFLDDKMMDRLKARKAKEKEEEVKNQVETASLETLRDLYTAKIQREKEMYEKHFDRRAFSLWTRLTRKKAGMSLQYTSIGGVCSPIRCVENRSSCTLRDKVDFGTMDRLHQEAKDRVEADHYKRIVNLQKRLSIVTTNATSPMSPQVYRSYAVQASVTEVWPCVFPLSDVLAPGRVKASSCKSNQGVGSRFRVRYNSGVKETYTLTALSRESHRISFELQERSVPLEAESVTHSIALKPVKVTAGTKPATFIELSTEFSKDAPAALIAMSHISKIDFFDWIVGEMSRRRIRKGERRRAAEEARRAHNEAKTHEQPKQPERNGTAGGDEKVQQDSDDDQQSHGQVEDDGAAGPSGVGAQPQQHVELPPVSAETAREWKDQGIEILS